MIRKHTPIRPPANVFECNKWNAKLNYITVEFSLKTKLSFYSSSTWFVLFKDAMGDV